MNNRIVLIVIYFGVFPLYFQSWLDCAKHQNRIDFYIVTDTDLSVYDIPENVYVFSWSFIEVKKKFQELFPYSICLNTPYKLTDYKPVYGKLFENYIGDYDWWGYIDIDIIFGNLNKFLRYYINEDYQRIGKNGHFSIFKNTEENRLLYLKDIPITECYKSNEVYRNNHYFSYDDIGGGKFRFGISYGMEQLGLKIADISAYISDVHINKRDFSSLQCNINVQHEVFEYNQGELFELHKNESSIVVSEIMYAHFQKRSLESHNQDRNHFYIIPNEIVDIYDMENDFRHVSNDIENKIWWNKLKMNNIKMRLKTGALFWLIKDNFILNFHRYM